MISNKFKLAIKYKLKIKTALQIVFLVIVHKKIRKTVKKLFKILILEVTIRMKFLNRTKVHTTIF